MEEKAVRSIPVSLLSFGSNKIVTVATTVALARLLDPNDFGLFALVLITMSLLSMFVNFGLGQVLIARRDLDERAQGTAFTIMSATAILMAIVLTALANPIAGLFDQPRLDLLLTIIAATLALSGPVWFYETLLQRELEFKKRLISKMVQNLTFAAVAIGLAVAGHGVLGLVIGNVASYGTYLLSLLLLAPYRVSPAWERARVGDLLVSGRGFLLQGVARFVQQNGDSFAVGKLLGGSALGAYFLGFRLAELTSSGIAEPVYQVTFPGFASMSSRGEEWTPAFLSALRMVALAVCPIGVVLSAAASPITLLLYGPKWLAMIGPLAILGLWAVIRPLETTLTWLLNSVGQADRAALITFLGLVPLLPALLVGASVGGLEGVAWVMLAHSVVMTAMFGHAAAVRAGVGLARQATAVAPVLVAGAVAWPAGRVAADALAGTSPAIATFASTAAVLAAFAVALSLVQPGLLPQAISQVAKTIRRQPAAAAP